MKAMYNQEPRRARFRSALPSDRAAGNREGRQIDRKKIRDEMASGKDTLWGDITWKDQLGSPWAVGQWQNGQMVGVFPPTSRTRSLAVPEAKWA
jgi:hypothetical protein